MSGWRRDVAAVKVAARDTETVHATRTSSGRRACRDGGIRIRRRGQPGRRQGAGAGAVRRHHRDRPRHRQAPRHRRYRGRPILRKRVRPAVRMRRAGAGYAGGHARQTCGDLCRRAGGWRGAAERGRASGRERVWQYVYVSVVAVTLTKKKMKKENKKKK